LIQPQPSVHPLNALEFLSHQFPEEYSALAVNTRHTTAVALLLRAKEFAKKRKYKGEILLECSKQWAIFLHYLLQGRYPAKLRNAAYNMEECVKTLVSETPSLPNQGIDYVRVLHGSPQLLRAAVNEDPTILRLYGSSHLDASIGLMRLMVMGAAWYHLITQHGTHEIDVYLSDPFLVYVGFAKGILSPTSLEIPPFQSEIVPIHSLQLYHETAAEIIRSENILGLTAPPLKITSVFGDFDYVRHYQKQVLNTLAMVQVQMNTLQSSVPAATHFNSKGQCLFAKARSTYIQDNNGADSAFVITNIKAMRNTIINHIGQLKRIRQPISKVVQRLAPGFSPQKQSKLYTAQDGSVQYHGAPPTMIRLHDTVSQFTPSPQSEIMAEVLEQPRFKRNRPKKVPFPEFEPCSMFKVDWQDIKSSSNTDRDSNDYFSMLSFHNRNVREILFEDKLVLLYRADINIRTNDDPDIDDYVHVQYVVHHVDEENCYLRYNELLYTPDEQPYIIGFFKPCIIVPITNAYILFQNNTVSTGTPGNETATK